MRRIIMKAVIACAAVASVTACVSREDVGYHAIKNEHYNWGEIELKQSLMYAPDNLYLKLNLAALYQNTGRADLAVPLYEDVIEWGETTYPANLTHEGGERRTLADVARSNMSLIGTVAKAEPVLMPSDQFLHTVGSTVKPGSEIPFETHDK